MWRGQSINKLVFGVADFVINNLLKIKEFFSMVTNNMFPYIFVFLELNYTVQLLRIKPWEERV